MDKSDPPRTFGVFKPVGHTIAAFPDVKQANNAVEHLQSAGFAGSGVTRYTPAEMEAQAETDIDEGSAMAAVGQEINLVKQHLELARKGCHFLVVETPDSDQASRVADLARTCGALTAQHYGMLIITELIDDKSGDAQVFESPDRGLDSDLPR